tara:strand:+ start:661 stop:1920 length:1260 start_codon:yes stop_codon:yes gene_type:complete
MSSLFHTIAKNKSRISINDKLKNDYEKKLIEYEKIMQQQKRTINIQKEALLLQKDALLVKNELTNSRSDLIINGDKNDQNGFSHCPADYPTEMICGKERRIITRHICVDSLFRKNYSSTLSSDFAFVLPQPINNVLSMEVTAMEFPNSWYTFSKEYYSNTFTITIYNAKDPSDLNGTIYDAEITHTIEIPEGNYQSDTLRDTINNIFTNTRNGLEYIYFDINEVNARCVFRTKTADDDDKGIFVDSDNPVDFSFKIDFTVPEYPNRPLYKNAGWMLGFRNSSYTVSASLNATVINTDTEYEVQTFRWFLESESSYGSGVHNYIFLDLDDFNKNFNTNSFIINSNESVLGNNTIGRISVTSGMNTTVTNSANDFVFKKREYFGPVKLERMRIKLVNKLGEPIELNRNDFSFVLEIKELYS